LSLTGINFLIARKVVYQYIVQVKQLNFELKQKIEETKTVLSEMEKQREFYEKKAFKNWIYSFNSITEADAFLLKYFSQQVKRYKGKLKTCQIQPSLSSSTVLQLKTIKLQAIFTNYLNFLHFLRYLGKPPPLFIIKKVAINKTGMQISVAIECVFVYNIKHET